MDLNDFVTRTLTEIITGVKNAQTQTGKTGAVINPPGLRSVGFHGVKTIEIEFDVAVTTTKGEAKKGGIGVMTGLLGIGVQGEKKAEHATENRIRFSVPVDLPEPAEEDEE